jgi:UDP:flavonoid glycosyltransferase YjiC (YdhE family)
MRVLFTVNPGTTIFNHLVPLAWALRTAGHEVRVASQPLFADEITRAGLTAVGVGRNLGIPRLLTAQGATEETIEKSRRGLQPPYNVAENPDAMNWEESMTAWHYTVEHAKYETVAITAGWSTASTSSA